MVEIRNDTLFQGTNGILTNELHSRAYTVLCRFSYILDFINPFKRAFIRSMPQWV